MKACLFKNFMMIFAALSFFCVGCNPAEKPIAKELKIEKLMLQEAIAQESRPEALPLAEDFTLEDINQNTYRLSAYRDKQPVLLLFWTTRCYFCRNELKTLNDIYPQLVRDKLEVLAIEIGDPAYRVDNFIKRNSLDFKVLLDQNTAVAGAYDILGVPTFILLNKKGQVVFTSHYFPQEKYKELIRE